uniref:CSON002579 protein n=1 Tax=Culicoides sonorensis TaxID=179676 RepID=A0A336MJC6_CULSO
MSTTSLGQEERKQKLDEYIFQRRVLLGCTAAIGVGLIVWIVAISTDHWFMVTGGKGIFVPETRRFFLSSHSGIWKVCRYAITPVVLSNVSVVRNFSIISHPARVPNLVAEFSKKPFVQEFLKYDTEEMQNSTEISETLKKVLFATWVTNDKDFTTYRDTFHQKLQEKVVKNSNDKHRKIVLVNPTDMKAVKEIAGGSLVSIMFNNTNINVLLPESLKLALFEGWQEKENLVFLLGAYAKALHISPSIVNEEGNEIIIRPPVPPKKSKSVANGYEYRPYKHCKWCQMFPSDQEIDADPSIDDAIIDYNRSEASFAIITVMVMAMGFVFSIYTFMNPRYMFKRLAGGIHFISACTSFVVVQVLAAAVEYEKKYLSFNFPKGSDFSFGYGFILAYMVVVTNFLCFILFMWYSRKRKGDKAATEELGMADEDIAIGR